MIYYLSTQFNIKKLNTYNFIEIKKFYFIFLDLLSLIIEIICFSFQLLQFFLFEGFFIV